MKMLFVFKPALAALILALATLACSLGPISADAPAASPPTEVISPAQITSAGAPVDPRVAEPCSIFNPDELAAALGAAPQDVSPYKDGYETSCYYSFEGGKSLSFKMELDRPGREAYDSVMQFVDVAEGSEPVELGEVAVVKKVDDAAVYLDAVVSGWYVSLQGFGLEREAILSLGRLLGSRFIAFTPPVNGGASESAPENQPLPGALLDMQVVIDSPAEMAGTTRLSELNIVGIAGFAMCSVPGPGPFVVTFIAPPATDPPTPVGTFSISVDGAVLPDTATAANISVGLGQSDVAQSSNWPGTITVSPGGTSGTFEVPGQIKGSWICTFSP